MCGIPIHWTSVNGNEFIQHIFLYLHEYSNALFTRNQSTGELQDISIIIQAPLTAAICLLGIPPSSWMNEMWPGFDYQTQHYMWVEFIGTFYSLCTQRFFWGYCGFLLSSKTSIWFDLNWHAFIINSVDSVPNIKVFQRYMTRHLK